MTDYRIRQHPILPIPEVEEIEFFWEGKPLTARVGETISAALFAHGIRVFGHHHKDGSPLGIFCANGQCSQCMVIADGKPLKACMELVTPNMHVVPSDGHPVLPKVKKPPVMKPIPEISVPVLIIGGGPAGMSAAIELGKLGVDVILIDDKHRLGGKLVLQTHRFFGSTEAVFASTRGIDIATKLEKEVRSFQSIQIWTQTTCLAVFSDKKIGVLKNGKEYVLVVPQVLLVATGAREKFLAFKGNSLPGVYGAGAFQTLVNRDLVRPAEKLFIVGGGNVGLIAGYHALQAGVGVVGLVEALPKCGGYKVHKDKLVRMGVPIYTSHTILSANGTDKVESVTIASIDENFQPIPGTEKSFACDSILIAVGLDPVNEFFHKAMDFGVTAMVAGDAEEIAEASAAIFSGKIKGLEVARQLQMPIGEIPSDWYHFGEILKSKPGNVLEEEFPDLPTGVLPVFHCTEEIPCDPCSTLCPQDLIFIDKQDIRSTPKFVADHYACKACLKCIAGCPGLAITLVDYRSNPEKPIVSIPYEFSRDSIQTGDQITIEDTNGAELGSVSVLAVRALKAHDRTIVVQVEADNELAPRIAGIKVQPSDITQPMEQYVNHVEDDTIVCRCEHVTAGEIRDCIRKGYRDLNEIKTVTKACMGSCGAKTCTPLIHRIYREEGIPFDKVTDHKRRPIFVEVPLGFFAGVNPEDTDE